MDMGFGDLFDSPWKVLIVAVVLIILFGSKKLPDAARSLGKSMRILKTEVGSLHHEENATEAPAQPQPAAAFPTPQLTPTPAPVPAEQQSQIDALQQQIRDLQRSSAMDQTPAPATVASEPERAQQSS
jgi:sec-independent protein translocase protein TatA